MLAGSRASAPTTSDRFSFAGPFGRVPLSRGLDLPASPFAPL